MDHRAIEELLGAYALNAVESHETDLIESHVAQCSECRAELDQHIEVAALLPTGAGFAPAAVWDSIAGKISTGAATPALSPNGTPMPGTVVPMRRWWTRPMAAAAVFVLVAGAAVVQSVRIAEINGDLAEERATVAALSEELQRPVLDTAVSRALDDPTAQRVVLGSQVSGSNAIIVLMAAAYRDSVPGVPRTVGTDAFVSAESQPPRTIRSSPGWRPSRPPATNCP